MGGVTANRWGRPGQATGRRSPVPPQRGARRPHRGGTGRRARRGARDSDQRRSARRDQLRVTLVGYTNAGKSSLMQAFTGSQVLVEEKLFATLDTTIRALQPEIKPRVLVSDKVGLIKQLDLVASFRSTLAEALELAAAFRRRRVGSDLGGAAGGEPQRAARDRGGCGPLSPGGQQDGPNGCRRARRALLTGHTVEDTVSLLRDVQDTANESWLWLAREVETARGQRLINERGGLLREQA